MNDVIFDRNMMALSRTSKEAAMLISKSSTNPSVGFETARSGKTVPTLAGDMGYKPLHSLFDPEREAEKISEWKKDGNYFVLLGLGGGYQARSLLARTDVTGVLVFERDPSIVRSFLSLTDMTDILQDQRFTLFIDADPGHVSKEILAGYVPVLCGTFSVVSLRPRVECALEYFKELEDAVGQAIVTVSEDYSVQAFFGKTWFRNIVRNLAAADRAWASLPPRDEILVTAAGPSLERGLGEIRMRRGSAFLLATDTSLPMLIKSGIKPDAVISIDCQQISYNHFMEGYPKEVPLVLDLASPPLLADFSEKPFFFASGHPLCRYVASRYRAFPMVDTSGGNVTHAAVSLASLLGAKTIHLYGADFSYPRGKSYARGTYLYSYFQKRSSRKKSVETHFSDFLFRTSSIEKEDSGTHMRYVTKPLESYRKNLEGLISRLPSTVIPVRSGGSPIAVPERSGENQRQTTLLAAGSARITASAFLAEYREDLANLAVAEPFSRRELEQMEPRQRDLLMTLLPVAACLRKQAGEKAKKNASMLIEARDYQVAFLGKILGSRGTAGI